MLSVTRALKGATGVLALTSVGSTVIRVISSILLTRLLTPQVFGIVGIINSLFFVVVLLTDLGFESYIVRHPHADDVYFRNVLWTVHVIRGMLLAAVAVAMAPLVATVLQKPELAVPLEVASLTLAINGLASFSLIVALRAGAARALSLLDFGLQFFQTALTIALAWWLRNAWAIIVGMIAYSAFRTILSYTLFPHSNQRLAANREMHREFMAWSRIVLASSFLTLLIMQSDKLVLARLLSLPQYGLYALALSIVGVPLGFAGAYMGRIVYPVYSRTWNTDPRGISRVYYAARQRTSLLYSLGTGALIGGAPLLVSILYDVRYRQAATYISLLAVSAALRLHTLAAAEAITAMGRVTVTLHVNLVRVAWLVVAGIIAFYTAGGLGIICVVGFLEVPALIYSWGALRRAGLLKMRYEIGYLAAILAGAVCSYVISRIGLSVLGR
jgi:O-antigen/teichoic acid export membrane protein